MIWNQYSGQGVCMTAPRVIRKTSLPTQNQWFRVKKGACPKLVSQERLNRGVEGNH